MKPKVKKLDVLSMHLDCATAKQDRTNQESQAESYVFMLRTLLRLGLPSGARKAWKSWLKCRFSSKKQGLVGLELGDGLCSGASLEPVAIECHRACEYTGHLCYLTILLNANPTSSHPHGTRTIFTLKGAFACLNSAALQFCN